MLDRTLTLNAQRMLVDLAEENDELKMPVLNLPDHARRVVEDELKKSQLVFFEETLGGRTELVLTDKGKCALDSVRSSIRRKVAQDLILRCALAGSLTGEGMLNQESTLEYQVNERVEKDARHYLVANGYLEGQGAWGGALIRPRVTNRGSRCAESGFAPEDFVEHAPRGGDTHSTVVNSKIDASGSVGAAFHTGIGDMTYSHNSFDIKSTVEHFDRTIAEISKLEPEDESALEVFQTTVKDFRNELIADGLQGAKKSVKSLMMAALTAFGVRASTEIQRFLELTGLI